NWSTLTAVNGTTYTDSAVSVGSSYVYRVYAVKGNLLSSASNQASATIPVPPPTAPSGLSASVSNNVVFLTWTANDGSTNSYSIARSSNCGANWSTLTAVNGTSYSDSAVSAGSSYIYRVYAVKGNLLSVASNQATATIPVPPPTAPSGLSASVSN